MIRVPALILAALLLTGCAGRGNRATSAAKKVAGNEAELAEKSRELTKGASDALDLAPTNAPTDLAQKFLDKNQQIVGLPLVPYDVIGILSKTKGAVETLDKRFESLAIALADRQKLEIKLDAANAELQDLGRRYESEHKKSAWKRFKGWGVATFGTVGFIAFIVLCPGIAVPIITRLIGWIVKAIPKLAGFLGVAATSSVDSIVVGVQTVKNQIAKDKAEKKTEPVYSATQVEELLKTSLEAATDRPDRDLIDVRKEVLAKDGDIPPIARVIG